MTRKISTYDNKIYSNGGRVLNITSIGDDFFQIRNRILRLMKKEIVIIPNLVTTISLENTLLKL